MESKSSFPISQKLENYNPLPTPFHLPGGKLTPEYFLILDIGTEAVKTLIFSTDGEKKQGKKITILGASLQYFDKFSVFDSRDFEADVIKRTISKALHTLNLSLERRGLNLRAKKVILGLPANILKGRVVFQSFIREKPPEFIDKKEEEKIFEQVLIKTQKETFQKFAADYGILPQDLHFISQKILEVKIDGYYVSDIQGYNGKKLDFRILITFLPKYYLRNIEKIIRELNLEISNIFHIAQGLILHLVKKPNAVFLDVGGEITQIFFVKNGVLEKISEFGLGGKTFSQALSERLGLGESEARVFKERYSKTKIFPPHPPRLGGAPELSEETRERIKEILWQDNQTWFGNLKDKLEEVKSLLPKTIFLFGGGSQLPEIQEILKKGDWKDLPFVNQPQVKVIYPKDLKNIQTSLFASSNYYVINETVEKILDTPQYTPVLLICYYYAQTKKNF